MKMWKLVTLLAVGGARRAFMQFSDDKTLARDHCKQISDKTTLGDASRLLSAIMFVNVWPSLVTPALAGYNCTPTENWKAANHATCVMKVDGKTVIDDDPCAP